MNFSFNPRKWWGRGYAEQVDSSVDRANVLFRLPDDTALFTPPSSRTRLREKFEWCRQNFGIVNELVNGIARHTVGRGISLQLNTEDLAWNEEAENQFEEWALTPDRCDAAGRRNFYEAQAFAVESFIGPGEFFALDASNQREPWKGEPCFQLFDPHEVGTPVGNQDTQIVDGVKVDANYVPQFYYVREQSGNKVEFKPKAAAQMVHWFKAHTANQVRGITPFAPVVANLVDVHELKRLTTKSAKAQQMVSVVFKNFDKKKGKGAFAAIENAGGGAVDSTADVAQMEKVYTGAGAGIAYVQDDGDVKLLSTNTPSPLVETFITDLHFRDVCLAPGVPIEFFWCPDKLSGSNQRFILEKADTMFQLTSDALIYRWIKREAFRVLTYRINAGLLAAPKDPKWFEKMSFQVPRKSSIDKGRDAASVIANLANGLTTLRSEYNKEGLNYRHEQRQWMRERIEILKIAQEEGADAEDLARLKANLPLWRPHATGSSGQAAQSTDEKPEPEEEKKKEKKKSKPKKEDEDS